MEALICSITAAGPVANRPPHMRCAPPTGCATFDSSAGILSAAGGDGGCLMVKRVVPALGGGVLGCGGGGGGLGGFEIRGRGHAAFDRRRRRFGAAAQRDPRELYPGKSGTTSAHRAVSRRRRQGDHAAAVRRQAGAAESLGDLVRP